MSSLNFFTPVYFENPEIKSPWKDSVMEKADQYFSFGQKRACIISSNSESKIKEYYIQEETTRPSLLKSALKIASYVTIILPLFALAVKIGCRLTTQFKCIESSFTPDTYKDSKTSSTPDTYKDSETSFLENYEEYLKKNGLIEENKPIKIGNTKNSNLRKLILEINDQIGKNYTENKNQSPIKIRSVTLHKKEKNDQTEKLLSRLKKAKKIFFFESKADNRVQIWA